MLNFRKKSQSIKVMICLVCFYYVTLFPLCQFIELLRTYGQFDLVFTGNGLDLLKKIEKNN